MFTICVVLKHNELENIPGSHNLPNEHFETSIYQMPFAGDILLYDGED